MLHITLAKSADFILIAPASANMIAKLAHAAADCLLSTVCLATKAKIILAPAMNKVMWENILVTRNAALLRGAGFHVIEPAHGLQACGDVGFGRMPEPLEIVEYCRNLALPKILDGRKVVITAGATREKIDPVRFLSNYSSGKMGYALAEAAHDIGASVVLISGATSLPKPMNIKTIDVESSEDMLKAAEIEASNADIFIGCAAVADYRAKGYHAQKIKKSANMTLELIKNTDIISRIKELYPKIFCVGFAAETNNIKGHGQSKFHEKNLDMLAVNDVSNGQVFGKDDNELHVITRDEKIHYLQRDTKRLISQQLLMLISQYAV